MGTEINGIEIKKYPKADLEKYKGLIFGFSMVVTLSMMIMAFEWKSYDKSVVDLQDRSVNSFEVLNEIPPTEIPPPPPPAITQPSIVEVPDEEEIMEEVKINIDIEMNEDTRIEAITVLPDVPEVEKEDVNAIFTIVETPASPVGGFEAFYKDVSNRMNYPAQARRMGIEGRVFVEFVVNRDGSLTDIKVVKGIGAGCDEVAIHVIETAPKWNPGKQRGKPVRQRMVLPIIFKLADHGA